MPRSEKIKYIPQCHCQTETGSVQMGDELPSAFEYKTGAKDRRMRTQVITFAVIFSDLESLCAPFVILGIHSWVVRCEMCAPEQLLVAVRR